MGGGRLPGCVTCQWRRERVDAVAHAFWWALLAQHTSKGFQGFTYWKHACSLLTYDCQVFFHGFAAQ